MASFKFLKIRQITELKTFQSFPVIFYGNEVLTRCPVAE